MNLKCSGILSVSDCAMLIKLFHDCNTTIHWLLSAARDIARTEGEGERSTKLSQVYYVWGYNSRRVLYSTFTLIRLD